MFVFVDAASFDRYLDLTSSTDIELLGASDRASEMGQGVQRDRED